MENKWQNILPNVTSTLENSMSETTKNDTDVFAANPSTSGCPAQGRS
jgi:hypothetical protein